VQISVAQEDSIPWS